ncbi:MAG TPA: hypothetical protein VD971_13735 [Phycisphaerales bacterium]|nr:hypothetical protein [Phycisphaerales bacterium]
MSSVILAALSLFSPYALATDDDGAAAVEALPSSDALVFENFPAPAVDGPAADWDAAWPARLGFDAADWRRGVVRRVEPPEGEVAVRPAGSRRFDVALREQESAVAQLRGAGVEVGDAPSLVRSGSFVVSMPTARPDENGKLPAGLGPRNRASITMRYVSATATGRGARVQTTWFCLDEPRGAPRGVVLLMPGLFGTPEGVLESLNRRLRERGWAVLRMIAQPSGFLEDATLVLDPADPGACADAIAPIFNERFAECALAAQGALRFLDRDRPDLAELPCVVIGFSGGAITLPTVVAREPERYDAAILVAGGVDFWLMSQTSNYRNWVDALRVDWKAPPTPEQSRAIDAAALVRTALDPYHTAIVLRGKPVLMVQGNADQAVPSPLGDVLWERAGRPERMILAAGHETLFMGLSRRFPALLDWLDKHFAKDGG